MSSMRTALVTAVMATTLLLGCDGSGDGGAVIAGLPTEYTGPGVYTVPAAPTVPFALAKVHVEQAGGTVSVYYDLPSEFFAQTPRVELTGTPDGTGTVHLSGDAGTSTCTVASAALQCEEDLTGVQFDAAAAIAALPPGDPQASAVAAFLSEPIGVLRMMLPVASHGPYR